MDYIEVELYGRKIRYFSEEHVEAEFRNIKGYWRKKPIAHRNGYKSYHFKSNGKDNYVGLHRLTFFIHNPSWNIYDGSTNNSIDHKNNEPSINNIENLRCVTNQENAWNRPKSKGYSWHKHKKKWQAHIGVDGKTIYLGAFIKEEDARNAYLEAKKIHHIIKEKVF